MSIIINAKSGAKAVDAERVRSLVEAGKLKPEARVASIDDGKTWISVSDALAQHDKQDATQEPLPPTGAAVLKLKSTKGLIEISEEKVRSLVDTGKLAPDRKLLTKNDGADWISYNQLSGDEEGQVEVESEEGVATPPKANPAAGGRPIRGGRATPNAKQDASVITNERDFIATLFLSIFFGGVGADRFYLGHTLYGILKLITFGGFGIWWLIDVVLVLTRKMKDAEGKDLSTKGGQGLALASLFLGWLGMVFCWVLVGWIFGVLALACGVFALVKYNKSVRSGVSAGGKGLAIAGIALSVISLLVTTLIICVVMAVAHKVKQIADDPTGAAADAIVSSAEIAAKVAQDPRAQNIALDALKAASQVAEKAAKDPRTQEAAGKLVEAALGGDENMKVIGDPDDWFQEKTKECSRIMTKEDQFILLALYKTILQRKVDGEARATILSWCQDLTTDSHMKNAGLHKWALASVAWAKTIPENGAQPQK